MLPALQQHLARIEVLCRRYGVKCLEAFGSAARADCDVARSDVDLLVLFEKDRPMNAADQYLNLLEDLEKLFERKVDLVDISAASNPYFVAEALRHRVRLYAA